VRSTIGIESFQIIIVVPSKKWKGRLLLRMMLNMFSLDVMLIFFVEGEYEPSLGKKQISTRVEEEKNFCYLKFDKALSNNIVFAMCNNESTY
jgi:hypothetical protein